MNRLEVIQYIIKKTESKIYLEIGVQKGIIFLNIDAQKKIAVDPNFLIPFKLKLSKYLRKPGNFNNSFFEKTSDAFFEEDFPILQKYPPEVIFIDGLHTYEQSWRDLVNTFKYAVPGAIVVFHDCSPPNEAAAYPANSIDEVRSLGLAGWTNEWCGDVWKTIHHIRTHFQDWECITLDCDYGLGIVKKPDALPPLSPLSDPDIEKLTYADFLRNKTTFLNLKEPSALYDFIK